MSGLTPNIIIFAITLAGLMKSSDIMVDGASSLAKRLGVSDLVIGLTVIALGTSLPELVVSVGSSYKNLGALAASNVIGSNVANVVLVLGISALIAPMTTPKTLRKIDKLYFLSTFVVFALGLLFFADGTHPQFFGIIYLAIFIGFIHSLFNSKNHVEIDLDDDEDLHSLEKSVLLTIMGLIFLIISGHYTVESAIKIARHLNVSEEVIGVTIVAFGTSLPELVASTIASLKKKADIAIGNIIGSNFMNIALVLGMSFSINPITFTKQMVFDGFVMIGVNIAFIATATFHENASMLPTIVLQLQQKQISTRWSNSTTTQLLINV